MIVYYTLCFLLLIFTVLSSLRVAKWWVKMWDAGRIQLAVIMAILLVFGGVFFGFQQIPEIVVAVALTIAIVYHSCIIFPFTPLHKVEIAKTNNRNLNLRMLTCNVRMSNQETGKLLEILQRKDPDVILLTEVNHWWLNKITILKHEYPHTILQPQENTYGIALFSKYPLIESSVKFMVEKEIPSIHTKIQIKDKQIQFIGLHPRPPAPWTDEENKDLEIIKAASFTNHNLLPTVVTGDLNDVCWSKITKAFKSISGLKDPRVGRGLFNTYNANIPFFRYPVDHFFISEHFKVREIRKLEYVGSDHFPVLLEVNLEKG